MRWLSGDYVKLPSRDPLKIRRLSDDYDLIMWTTLEAEFSLAGGRKRKSEQSNSKLEKGSGCCGSVD